MINFISELNNTALLGHTIPELLTLGCDRQTNIQALNQYSQRQWQPLSNALFRRYVEELALGFLNLNLEKGDRLAMMMQSDLSFALVDLAALSAGLVDVPIDLTQTIENILYCLNHSEAKALVISDFKLFSQISPYLGQAKFLQWIILAETPKSWLKQREQLLDNQAEIKTVKPPPNACLQISQLLHGDKFEAPNLTAENLPQCIGFLALDDLKAKGKELWSIEAIELLQEQLSPQDIATIIYIASEEHNPKGVMLSHENITSNALSAFGSYPNLKQGDAETVLLFLPLTHIFARVFLYGHLAYGHSIYFSSPTRLIRHLKEINPTVLITVPRLLEKIHERILAQGETFAAGGLKNRVKAIAFNRAMKLAQSYDVSSPPQGLENLQWQLAQKWVFSQWQDIFGTRLHSLICGGAALRPALVNFFNGSGIPVIQGYGLTETSGVVCYNRKDHHQADTVGEAMPATKILIAEDDEILIKAPFVMQGYYKDPVGTAQAIDAQGWFHTGDRGYLTPEGFLQITGVKKAQFKLSTGKYVSLKPLENSLKQSSLVKQAIAVGMNKKFCGMLIFPNHQALKQLLEAQQIKYDLNDPRVIALYQNLINLANCHLPYWSTVRKFALMAEELPEVFIADDGTLYRDRLYIWYASEIDALYSKSGQTEEDYPEIESDLFTPTACPIYAQSLLHV